ncbi:MAG: IS3 family transposase [Clostridiales bacterium]|nr:IS3 family transposase [Clostridiales bacterium]
MKADLVVETIKKEIIHWKSYGTRRELRLEMFKYIEGFYNTKRIQKRLGYISPMEWLKKWQISRELLVA